MSKRPAGAPDTPAKRAKAAGGAGEAQAQALTPINDHLWEVVNSPYGTAKARAEKLGWGHVFKANPAVPGDKRVRIGTSSLNATPGKGREMKALLETYRKKFTTLEHCATYHKLPEEKTWAAWGALFSKSGIKGTKFKVTIKAHKFLTHDSLLAINEDTKQHIASFVARLRLLGDSLGAVLVQLPPQFKRSEQHLQRLKELGTLLPSDIRFAFDFRNNTMFCEEVYAVMKQFNWAMVVYHRINEHAKDFTTPFADTCTDTVYIRLHGSLQLFCGDYGAAEMAKWAGFVSHAAQAGKQVYVFFNNNESVCNKLASSIVDATCLAQQLDAAGQSGAAAPPGAASPSKVDAGTPGAEVPTPQAAAASPVKRVAIPEVETIDLDASSED
eukprot:TRINITY_DN19082_c0_g1_i1.p1 TRINITY_DN19082_c0_g1~~TRINITY_DN19082_c0_g1_i1.p1  ORF type:complete len:385 (+),score=159.33 TRINITY_DN19082_c0_g1_i1:58-1212(+)